MKLKLNIKEGYVLEQYLSVSALEGKYPNIARVMKETSKIATITLRKGKNYYTCDVFESGNLTKLNKVPSFN